MSFLQRIFGQSRPDPRDRLRQLYASIIAKGRELHWYEEGKVPDTLDGRFGMISSVLAVTMLRMEQIPEAAQDTAYLTELFVEDMDAQMREAGIGDVVVAKDMGKIMSVLGGRLGAFRGAFDDPAKLDAAIERNIYESGHSDEQARRHVAAKLSDYWQALQKLDHPALMAAGLV
jgi:cytochrome b pre-mRNA-processing protein 3